MKRDNVHLLLASFILLLFANYALCDGTNVEHRVDGEFNKSETEIKGDVLSRKKRYLIFPHGSSVQVS